MKLISAGLFVFLMPSKKVWHSTDKYRRTIYRMQRQVQEPLQDTAAAKTQYDKNCEAIQYRKARSRQMDSFIKELRNQDLIKEFDARLWGSLVDFITVYSKDDIRVTFKDGTEIRA